MLGVTTTTTTTSSFSAAAAAQAEVQRASRCSGTAAALLNLAGREVVHWIPSLPVHACADDAREVVHAIAAQCCCNCAITIDHVCNCFQCQSQTKTSMELMHQGQGRPSFVSLISWPTLMEGVRQCLSLGCSFATVPSSPSLQPRCHKRVASVSCKISTLSAACDVAKFCYAVPARPSLALNLKNLRRRRSSRTHEWNGSCGQVS